MAPAVPTDDNMGGEEPMEDMDMAPAVPTDNNMSGEESMEDMDMNNESGDSTMDIINQLSDEDKESVRAYAESMLDKNDNTDSMGDEEMPEMPTQQEGKCFTKKQLKEEFGVKPKEVKATTRVPRKKTITKNSPFNPPIFN